MRTTYGPFVVLIALLGILLGLDCLGIDSRVEAPGADADPVVDTGPMTGVEKSYLEVVIKHLQTVSDHISALEMLFGSPDMDDEDWRASVTVLLNRIESAHGSVATLEPTERLQPFQDASGRALAHAATFAALLRDMLVVGEVALTEEAERELVATGEAFGEAEGLLMEFLQVHPVPEE